MRVGAVCLVLIAFSVTPAVAADPVGRGYRERSVEPPRMSARAERYYGPRVALPGVAEQVMVTRGPRVLLEEDSLFGLFQPVYASRRLPSSVRRIRVNADVPLYETEQRHPWRR